MAKKYQANMSTDSPVVLFSVSDFIAVVNQTFDYAFSNVEIEGEISSFKINQGKFVFFDLRDEAGTINCFMMTWQLRTLIEDGMRVIISAAPKITDKGKFSLTVRSIRPSGEGAIKKSFELLKAKLDNEGLFSLERKRTLPLIPQYVGVISSTQAAGYADFVKIINDRWGGLIIDVAHVQVQGDLAADQIINAIKFFNEQQALPEVLVIIRGGGSADDLAIFNDEPLVRAIAGSRIPTLVGVGHETDKSLADLVADVSAATPSNAAQILVPDKYDIIRSVKLKASSVLPRITGLIDRKNEEVARKLEMTFEKTIQKIDLNLHLIRSIKNVISELDPNKVLARGYAIIRGRPEVGSIIDVELSKIIIKAEVKDVSRK